MAKLLETRKAKIILGAVVLVAVLAVVLFVVLGGGSNSRGFRIIRVSELAGTAAVTSEGKEYAVYKDMKLGEGYALVTGADSFVRMVLDDDKYIRVEEDSKVTFETLGKSGSGRTTIYLEYGAITNEVTTALGEDEEYIINTPNTALAIKGTFFRVAVDVDKNGAVSVDVFTYGGVVECKRILPNGQIVDESTLIEAGYKTKVYMTSEDTVYQVEGADGKENVAVLSINEIPDADIVDMYVASMNGHEMYIDTEEIWEEIEEREIDIEDYTSNRDGQEVLPLNPNEDGDGTNGGQTSEIDLDEARLWIYDSDDLYEADGSVKWNEGLTRYSADYDSLSEAIEMAIKVYKAHGYSYVGEETDVTSLTEDSFNNGRVFFKLELTDETLLQELEEKITSGKENIKEFTTLAVEISYWDNQYRVWIFGEFRFDGKELVRFTENMEWCPRWLLYDEANHVWRLEWEMQSAVVASGSLAQGNIEWEIIGTTLYVTGTGAIPDFEESGAWFDTWGEQYPDIKPIAWEMYYDVVDNIVLSEGITAIGAYNFCSFSKVTGLRFPDTLTKIGKHGMNGMGLYTLEISRNITELDWGAFQNLNNLTYVNIPSNIKKIPGGCFTNCYALARIDIEEGVQEIDDSAFCMAEVYDLEGNRTGGSHGFEIHVPQSVTVVHEEAFFAGGFEDSLVKVYGKKGSYIEQWVNATAYKVIFIEE